MRNLQSHSFAKKQRFKKWTVGVLLILVAFLFIFCIFLFFNLKSLEISEIEVYGADSDITSLIQATVISQLKGDYFHMFSYDNSLIYPKNKIIEAIKNNFPRVANVEVGRDTFTKLRVTVNQKVPKAVVCTMLPDFNGSQLVFSDTDPCYYADDNGYLFEKSPVSDDSSYIVYFAPNVQGVGTSTDMVGTYATSTDDFKLLQSLVNGAINVHIPVDGLLIKENGDYELYASSTIIYFNDEEGIANERDNLVAFWTHMNISDTKPVFDYIKLQFGSNIFYKTLDESK